LARRTDRLESVSLAAVVLVGLLLVPVMLMFGSIVHAHIQTVADQQAKERHAVVATLTQDARDVGAGGHGFGDVWLSEVPAEWTLPDGSTHTGRVPVANGVAGARIKVWLDGAGRVVDRPLNSSDAIAEGAVVTVSGWLVAVGLLALVQTGVHGLLNRRRFQAWDRQWASVEPGWNNYRH